MNTPTSYVVAALLAFIAVRSGDTADVYTAEKRRVDSLRAAVVYKVPILEQKLDSIPLIENR